MKWHRIYAVLLRHLLLFPHNLNKIADVFYWPTMELILWGITSLFIKSLNPGLSSFVAMIVAGIIFWQVVWRAQIEVTVGILEEFWNRNLVNLFVTPLRLSEWIAAFMLLGILKLTVGMTFASLLAYFLYQMNILVFGFKLVPFLALLLMSGWCIGLFVGSLLIRYGSKIENFAWSIATALSPFSAIYYPVAILPQWAQKVAMVFPTSYLFEGMREVIGGSQLDWSKIIISFILNLAYFSLALFVLHYNFRKALQKGLVKT